MPILWRYLLSNYLKVLLLCLTGFISILLTTRLDEIAHFATLGPEGIYILLFTLHQIPYILPIALPISCLISSMILIQRLSRTHELTAMRAAGLSLKSILAPILFAAAFLSLANFFVVSEMSTHSHLSTGLLKNELRSINPLLLLHNKHLMKLRGIFFYVLGPYKMGESASDAIIAMPNHHERRINVMLAGNLSSSSSSFKGENLAIFTSLTEDFEKKHDNMVVENIGESKTSIKDFSQMMQKRVWTLNNDHLRLPLLLVRLENEKKALKTALDEGEEISRQKQIRRSIYRIHTEIVRRFSVALAVFSFTLMGAAFGMNIGRYQTNRKLFAVISLSGLFLVSYFAGKGIDHLPEASMALYLCPHLLIGSLSIWNLRKISRGVE